MVVAELMKRQVRTVNARDMLADAIIAMLDAGVSALPVLDARGEPVGVVTNREILQATLDVAGKETGPRGLDAIPVEEFMAPWPPAVGPDTDVDDAARLMSYLDLKHLFVMDGARLVGVISQTDIVDTLATARHAVVGRGGEP